MKDRPEKHRSRMDDGLCNQKLKIRVYNAIAALSAFFLLLIFGPMVLNLEQFFYTIKKHKLSTHDETSILFLLISE